MHVRQIICVFMLFVYLGHFFVFSYSLITYACRIIAVYSKNMNIISICNRIILSVVYKLVSQV